MARPRSIPDFADLPGPVTYKIPEGDNRVRAVCDSCGFVNYVNPKVVVGSVCTWQDRILLCRRAIDPRKGYWTLPAGYLEEEESAPAGAVREAEEEACVKIRIDALLAVYSIPRISQVQLIYRARLPSSKVAAGPETEESRLWAWDEIPWDDLAFPSVRWSLNHFDEMRGLDEFAPRTNPEGQFGDMEPPGL